MRDSGRSAPKSLGCANVIFTTIELLLTVSNTAMSHNNEGSFPLLVSITIAMHYCYDCHCHQAGIDIGLMGRGTEKEGPFLLALQNLFLDLKIGCLVKKIKIQQAFFKKYF